MSSFLNQPQSNLPRRDIRKLIYRGTVLNNVDPKMLGRIRVNPEFWTKEDIATATVDFNEKTDIWKDNDPFICLPLLPFHLNAPVPSVGDAVNIILQNLENRFEKRGMYYIGAMLSSPMSVENEVKEQSENLTTYGSNVKDTYSVKNQDGTYPNPKSEGIFPEPDDVGLVGKGTSDLIIKPNDVFLRAGRNLPFNINKAPQTNPNRAYVQLSMFGSKEKSEGFDTIVNFSQNIQNLKYVVEWLITNPDNPAGVFTGTIYLYKLKPSSNTLSTNFKLTTNLETEKSLITYKSFQSKSLNDTIIFINKFIQDVNSGTLTQVISKPGNTNLSTITINDQFPYGYRPSPPTYNWINPTNFNGVDNVIAFTNITQIYLGVKFNSGVKKTGIGIVGSKDTFGLRPKTSLEFVENKSAEVVEDTFASLGANQIAFLSHDSSVPGKSKINMQNNVKGIDATEYQNNIVPNTSSMVRGEELLELLDLIVRYLISHVHAYHGLPPVPVGQDGTSSLDVLTQLQEAYQKVLNKNIRIN